MFKEFGNKVRIKTSPETLEKSLAGKIGVIHGETTPSMMNLSVIGNPNKDYAINVYFEDLRESFWFAADLLEQLDYGQGTVITLDGIDKSWTKGKNGEWIEEENHSLPQGKIHFSQKAELRRKWWKFWKK